MAAYTSAVQTYAYLWRIRTVPSFLQGGPELKDSIGGPTMSVIATFLSFSCLFLSAATDRRDPALGWESENFIGYVGHAYNKERPESLF